MNKMKIQPQDYGFILHVLKNESRPILSRNDIFYFAYNLPRLKKHRPNSVYLLGDFYIGQTTNISSRLLGHKTHIYPLLSGEEPSSSNAATGAKKWFDRYGFRSIPVFHLSDDTNDELKYTQIFLKHGFPIESKKENCLGYYDQYKTIKELRAVEFLKELGYTLIEPEERKKLLSPKIIIP